MTDLNDLEIVLILNFRLLVEAVRQQETPAKSIPCTRRRSKCHDQGTQRPSLQTTGNI